MTASQSIIIGESIASKNMRELSLLLATIISDQYVIGAAVYDSNETVIDSYGLLTSEKPDLSKRISVNYVNEGGFSKVGSLQIVMSDAKLRVAAKKYLIDHLLLGLLLLVTSIAATVVTHRKIVVLPLRRLADKILDARSGSRHLIEWPTNDEIGELVSVFNQMQKRLENHENAVRESRERFAGFAASASDWYWEMDANLRFSYISESFKTKTGELPELYYGKRWENLLENDFDKTQLDRHLNSLKRHVPFRNFDYKHKLGSGRYIWIRLSGIPIYEKNGTFAGYRGSGTDITKVMQIEQAKRETDQRFRALIEQIPSAILIKDLSGKYLSANSTWYRWFNPGKKKIEGKTISDFAPSNHAEEINNVDTKVIETLTPIEKELQTPIVGGGEITTLLQKFPVLDEQGKVIAIGSVNTDISERKRMEENLRQALIKAEEANHSKSEFLATMSHELRTPLNAIIGFSGVMIGEYFGELGNAKYLNYANDIKNSGEHLLSLISDILDISAIELGRRDIVLQPVHLDALISNCVKLIRAGANASNKNIEVTSEVPASLPLVDADDRALQQILLNLIGNAVKFSKDGGGVHVSVHIEGENVVITVKDTGLGIAERDLPDLTKPFVRGHNNALIAKDGVGQGLGLAIVKSLVDAHGGTLSIASELEKGTIVTVELPIKNQNLIETNQ